MKTLVQKVVRWFFYALGKLGRQWRDIAVDIQDGLLEYLRQNFQVGNNVTKIGSLAIWYSLTKIDLPLENIDQGTVDCLRESESLLGPEVLSEDDLGNL